MDIEARWARAQAERATSLDLSGMSLHALPSHLNPLPKLRTLKLAHNYLRQPPGPELCPGLTALDLHDNHLRQVDDRLLGHRGLRHLRLSRNALSALPDNFDQLTNLRMLDLSDTGVARLPIGLFSLRRLEELRLGGALRAGSYISHIVRLETLTVLDMHETRLNCIPEGIASLRALETLNVAGNSLVSLPTELLELPKLRHLDVSNNPLHLPPEIRDRLTDPDAILRSLFAEKRRPLHEAKIVLVGEASVGKTSIARRLLHDTYDKHESATEGIEIAKWQVAYEDNLTLKVNLWDFGGQEIMHSTHQFFLTKRSLYVLVINCRNSAEQNRLEYWLKMIDSFGFGSPVIIVGNHSDQSRLDIDRRGLQRKYPNIANIVETSCYTSQGLDELRAVIRAEIRRLPHIHDTLLPSWFDVKAELVRLDKDYLSFDDYVALCEDHGIRDEGARRALLSVVNDLGVVVNFADDPRLQDTSILKPEWVTNGVYRIINAPAVQQHEGTIGMDAIRDALGGDSRYPVSKQMFIVDMMKKFELCVPVDAEGDRYLIPDLLPQEEPFTGSWRDALRFEYQYVVLPQSIMSRFIARTHGQVLHSTCWRNGVVVSGRGDSVCLVRADKEDRRISIFVDGTRASHNRELLRQVRHGLEVIHHTVPGLTVEEYIILSDEGNNSTRIPYGHLLDMEDLGHVSFLPPGSRQERGVCEVLDEYEDFLERREREGAREHQSTSSAVLEAELKGTEQPLARDALQDRRVPVRLLLGYAAVTAAVAVALAALSFVVSGGAFVVIVAATTALVSLIVVASMVEADVISEAGFTRVLGFLFRDKRTLESDWGDRIPDDKTERSDD